jgi:hypothetical protein
MQYAIKDTYTFFNYAKKSAFRSWPGLHLRLPNSYFKIG